MGRRARKHRVEAASWRSAWPRRRKPPVKQNIPLRRRELPERPQTRFGRSASHRRPSFMTTHRPLGIQGTSRGGPTPRAPAGRRGPRSPGERGLSPSSPLLPLHPQPPLVLLGGTLPPGFRWRGGWFTGGPGLPGVSLSARPGPPPTSSSPPSYGTPGTVSPPFLPPAEHHHRISCSEQLIRGFSPSGGWSGRAASRRGLAAGWPWSFGDWAAPLGLALLLRLLRPAGALLQPAPHGAHPWWWRNRTLLVNRPSTPTPNRSQRPTGAGFPDPEMLRGPGTPSRPSTAVAWSPDHYNLGGLPGMGRGAETPVRAGDGNRFLACQVCGN